MFCGISLIAYKSTAKLSPQFPRIRVAVQYLALVNQLMINIDRGIFCPFGPVAGLSLPAPSALTCFAYNFIYVAGRVPGVNGSSNPTGEWPGKNA
jgi:hypothetical protein